MNHEPGSRSAPNKIRPVWFVRRVIIAIALVLLVLIVLIVACLIWATYQVAQKNQIEEAVELRIEKDFSGILREPQLQENKTFHILVVHGIGSQCPGYSHDFISGIMSKTHMMGDDDLPEEKISKVLDELRERDKDLIGLFKKNSLTVSQWITDYDTDLCEGLGTEHGEKKIHDRTEVGKAVCKAIHRASDDTNHNCEIIRTPARAAQSEWGFLRTSEYQHDSITGLKVKIYELVWDPVTAAPINKFLHQSEYPKKNLGQYLINSFLKTTILHEKLADAVLYIGGFKKAIQFTTVMAMCKVMQSIGDRYATQGPVSNVDERFKEPFYGTFSCAQDVLEKAKNNIDKRKKEKDLRSEHEIIIISHSLGTRLLFDSLGLISYDNIIEHFGEDIDLSKFYSPSVNEQAKSLRKIFQMLTTKIIVFANQVPLLAIPNQKASSDKAVDNSARKIDGAGESHDSVCRNVIRTNYTTPPLTTDLGENFTQFLEGRKPTTENSNTARKEFSPLKIVTFTEPNDILNYDLEHWYSTYVGTDTLKKLTKDKWEKQCNSVMKDRDFCLTAINTERKGHRSKIKVEEDEKLCSSILSVICKENPDDISYYYSPLILKNNRFKYYGKAVEEVCGGQACGSEEISEECSDKLRLAHSVVMAIDKEVKYGLHPVDTPRNADDQALKEKPALEIVNILIDLADWKVWPWVADPSSVHTNYWEAEKVYSLIACGGSKKTNQPNRCAEP